MGCEESTVQREMDAGRPLTSRRETDAMDTAALRTPPHARRAESPWPVPTRPGSTGHLATFRDRTMRPMACIGLVGLLPPSSFSSDSSTIRPRMPGRPRTLQHVHLVLLLTSVSSRLWSRPWNMSSLHEVRMTLTTRYQQGIGTGYEEAFPLLRGGIGLLGHASSMPENQRSRMMLDREDQ
jgi:hypothetical protein